MTGNKNHYWRMLVGIVAGLGLFPWHGHAEILVPILPSNLVDVTVNVDVQFDSTAQLYTYAGSTSTTAQALALTALQLVSAFDVFFWV